MGRLEERMKQRGGVRPLEPGNSLRQPVEQVCIMIMGKRLCFSRRGEIPVTHITEGPDGILIEKQFSLMVSLKGIYTNKKEP